MRADPAPQGEQVTRTRALAKTPVWGIGGEEGHAAGTMRHNQTKPNLTNPLF